MFGQLSAPEHDAVRQFDQRGAELQLRTDPAEHLIGAIQEELRLERVYAAVRQLGPPQRHLDETRCTNYSLATI